MVEVTWRDGKEYKGKVIDVVKENIKVRYHKFKSSHDEWIDLAVDGKRVKRPWESSSGPSGPDDYASGGVVPPDAENSGRKRRKGSEDLCSDENEERTDNEGLSQKKSRMTSPLQPTGANREGNVSTEPREEVRHSAGLEAVQCLCSFCSLEVSGPTICCQVCKGNFHAEVVCLGVHSDVVEVLKRNEDGALSYNCTECRLVNTNNSATEGSYGPVLKQVICTVKELAKFVRVESHGNGSKQAKCCSGNPSGLQSQPIPQREQTLSRNDVLDQVRELKEREKRADSIIFRGFGDVSLEEVNSRFEGICQELGLSLIPLTGITKISSSPVLYRAKVANETQRRTLLMKAPELKLSRQFSQVYINRDLTKQQREEVMERRRNRRLGQEVNGENVQSRNPTDYIQNQNFPGGRGRGERIGSQRTGNSSRGVGSFGPTQESNVWPIPSSGSRGRNTTQRGRGGTVGRGGGRGRGRANSNSEINSTQRISFGDIPHIRNF